MPEYEDGLPRLVVLHENACLKISYEQGDLKIEFPDDYPLALPGREPLNLVEIDMETGCRHTAFPRLKAEGLVFQDVGEML